MRVSIKAWLNRIFGKEISQFVGGSLVATLGSLLSGFLGYLYHLFMGRMLGPSDYGILASLLSLLYIFSVPTGTFSLVVTKFSADLGKSRQFFQKTEKKTIWFSLLFLLLFIALTPAILSFLHLGAFVPVFLIGLCLAIGLLVTFEGAILQGRLNFVPLAVGGTMGTAIKLLLGIIFVYFGLGINGAVLPMVLMAIFSYFYFQYFLRKKEAIVPKGNLSSKKLTNKEIWDYAQPIFFFTLSFALLYSVDVIFARHFLTPQEAGWYGSLSTLGKIIYFLISPLSLVLFPMASGKKSKQENSHRLFKFSFSAAIFIALFLTLAYFSFPNLILGALYGSQFLPASRFLGLFGVFLSFYSLAYFLGNFMLSQEKTKVAAFFPLLALLLQVILILFFHQSILAILKASIFTCGLLFFSFLVYYLINRKDLQLNNINGS